MRKGEALAGEKKSKRNVIIIVVAVIVVIGIIGSMGGGSQSSSSSSSSSSVESSAAESSSSSSSSSSDALTDVDASTPQGQIESVIRNRISSEFHSTDIDSVTINEDLGTDKADDYIALVYLTWNGQNSGKTSKEVLSMFSEDLSATVGKECPNVQEIAIFWEVPYLNTQAKCSYERKGEGMYEMDMFWPAAFDK